MRSFACRAAAACAVTLAAFALAGSVPAVAASTHRAVVVTEANGTVVTRTITFMGDSVSGIDALRDAGAAPAVYGFTGIGGAVCAMHVPPGGPVIGCPADASCLTCSPSNYWAYFRAPAGTTGFTWSRTGPGSTRVHDGDVEGWRWGGGEAPPFPSGAVAGIPPRAAPPPPPAGVGATGGSSPRTTGPAGGPAATTTAPPAPAAAPATTASQPTTTTRTGGSATGTGAGTSRAEGSRAASHRADRSGGANGSGGGGSAAGFAVFGAIAVALAVAVVAARRIRRS